MKALTVLLAALVVTLTTGYVAERSNERINFIAAAYQSWLEANAKPLSPAQLAIKYRMWNATCIDYRKDVQCIGVKAPNIMTFEVNPMRPGLQGYYDGTDTIYIREGLRSQRLEEVVAHEMSHYIDVQVMGLKVPGRAKPICWSEKRAWAVSDAYWIEQGRKSKVVGSDWADWYRHCTKFKQDMYPDVT
jgi:hypothetical protein